VTRLAQWVRGPVGVVLFVALGVGCESTPTLPSVEMATWIDVTAGGFHSCGITSDAAGFCWGSNTSGQLGAGLDASAIAAPLRTAAEDELRSIDAGLAHTCAVTGRGGILCWGSNEYGQLGIGLGPDQYRPIVTAVAGNWISVSAGTFHTCALDDQGRIACWGRNDRGQLGRPEGPDNTVPGPVVTERRFVSISAGTTHTCGVSRNAIVYCWGANGAGQLGVGSASDASVPMAVEPAFFTAVAVAAGFDHTCAASQSGIVSCWGSGELGQLGGGLSAVRTPFPVDGLFGVREVAVAGEGWSCGLVGAGYPVCWGFNPSLGLQGDISQVEYPGIEQGFRGLSAGDGHLCALDGDGRAVCWGRGTGGQLGQGKWEDASMPVRVGA
jgi:alpha-tubulin suppressor-like RCC1 family protein